MQSTNNTKHENAFAKLYAIAEHLGYDVVHKSHDNNFSNHVFVRVEHEGISFYLSYYFVSYGCKKETITTGTCFGRAANRNSAMQSELKYGEGITDETKHLHAVNFEVNNSPNKDAALIARDIAKRFLPDYIKAYNIFKLRDKTQEDYRHDINKRINAIKGSIDGSPGWEARSIDCGFSVYNKGVNVEAQVGSKVRLTLDGLSDSLTIEILELLRNASI